MRRGVHSERELPATVRSFVSCIRGIEESGQNSFPVSRGAAYGDGVVGGKVDESGVPEIAVSIAEEIDKRERDPERGKVGDGVGVIVSDVVVDGRVDHDGVLGMLKRV